MANLEPLKHYDVVMKENIIGKGQSFKFLKTRSIGMDLALAITHGDIYNSFSTFAQSIGKELQEISYVLFETLDKEKIVVPTLFIESFASVTNTSTMITSHNLTEEVYLQLISFYKQMGINFETKVI